jgi:hypothetical protein
MNHSQEIITDGERHTDMNDVESDGDDPLGPATYEIQPKIHRLDRYPI